MEGRHCGAHRTIEANRLTGASTRKAGAAAVRLDLELVDGYAPRLKDRRRAPAG